MATLVLGITELDANTNNKFAVHNQALNEIEVLGNAAPLEILDTPPVTPASGDLYIVGTVPTGAWAGQANNFAVFNGVGWEFVIAVTGIRTLLQSLNQVVKFNGTNWESVESLTVTTAAGTVTLANSDAMVQAIDPNLAARDVILPDPPLDNKKLIIINDSDNLSANSNTLNIKETAAGAITQTLDDTTGNASVNAMYSSSAGKWVYWF